MAEARPAATVVVVRPGLEGPEILLLQRSRRVGFFPDAWVFPGGRVDEADAATATTGRVAGLPDTDRHFAVAALRECFEETGVWLGRGRPDPTLRLELVSRRATLHTVPGLVADLGALQLWSWWITPDTEPKRYDTRFFVSIVPRDATLQVQPDGIETVAAIWLSARAALAEGAAGRLFMAPPTFRTLEELAVHDSTEGLWAAAAARPVRAIQPILRRGLPDTDGWALLLPGDPEHPDTQAVHGGTRIVMRDGGWVSEDVVR